MPTSPRACHAPVPLVPTSPALGSDEGSPLHGPLFAAPEPVSVLPAGSSAPPVPEASHGGHPHPAPTGSALSLWGWAIAATPRTASASSAPAQPRVSVISRVLVRPALRERADGSCSSLVSHRPPYGFHNANVVSVCGPTKGRASTWGPARCRAQRILQGKRSLKRRGAPRGQLLEGVSVPSASSLALAPDALRGVPRLSARSSFP